MDKNRYREIAFCDKAMEIEGCPVAILEYRVLLDRKKHTSVLEIIWQNLDEEKVKYVDIEIERLDRNFNYIGEAPVAYTYNRVNAKSQALFGEKQYIDLLTMDTRSVDIKIISVEMLDGYIWEEKGQAFSEDEPGEPDNAEAEGFYEEEPEAENYAEFEEEEIDFENLTEDFELEEEIGYEDFAEDEDLEFISLDEEEAYEEREFQKSGKKRFRIKAELDDEFEEEEDYGEFDGEDYEYGDYEYEDEEDFDIEADMEERRGRILTIAASSAGGVLILVLLLCIVFQNDIKAKRYEKNGEYEAMMAILDDTILMKNNNSLLKSAKKYIENKEYEKALELLAECGESQEITELMEQTRYLQACSYMEEEKYANAATMFYHLGDYEDSEQRYEECKKKSASASENIEAENQDTDTGAELPETADGETAVEKTEVKSSKEALGIEEALEQIKKSEPENKTSAAANKSQEETTVNASLQESSR